MRTIDQLGLFWLDGHPDDALSGRLLFDPSSGIELSIVGMFDNLALSEARSIRRIIGWIGSQKVTLEDAFISGSTQRSPGVSDCRFRANRLFVGAHLEGDTPTFKTVEFTASNLDSWIGISGISEYWNWEHRSSNVPDYNYRLNYRRPEPEVCDFTRGRITIDYAHEQGGNEIHGVNFRQWPVVRVEYGDPQQFDVVRKDVGRFQSLMSLCIDEHPEMDGFILTHPEIRAKLLDGSDGGQQRIEFLAPPLRYTEPTRRKPVHRFEMLLDYHSLGGIDRVAAWLDSADRFQRSLDSFMSIKHGRPMYAENRFLNVTFAAESFHEVIIGGHYMNEDAFKNLLDSYLSNTPEEHQHWLLGKIQYGNEPPLRKRLHQLATRSVEATRPIIGDRDRWAFVVATVRNELTHLSSERRSFDERHLLPLTESVFAVVQICMLLQSGVPIETVSKKAASYRRTWYQAPLKQSLDEIWANIKKSH
ncbi:HEPN domain-containing protein [Micromonospora sp. NBC_01813]|uniref:ApeA N-terminal domain 1-containing protein n=1 Tax=Micromonospora sp. NBC_01813 TaxID=2975988 RepID=UPI002DDA4D68|nr:HEPN domain-containing protein [Micromonospora sp. NBC_01813]WSA09750.1 hypothetical protein OG958_02735 [Micromonospora sp. NBC_01813]